jgi:hypothetical protein
MNRPLLHPRYDKTAPTVSDEIARYREAQERVRQRRLGDAFGPRCDRFAAQPPAASSCQHRIAIAKGESA